MTVLVSSFIFAWGLVVGSFLNALFWRLRTKRSMRGRSMCPHCKHQLTARDLVPLFSWLALRGRCRYCHKPIHWRYPVLELVCGSLFALSYLVLYPTGALWIGFVIWLYFLASLIFLAAYDLAHLILPDRVLIPAITVAILLLILRLTTGAPLAEVQAPLIAGLLGAGTFYILAALSGGKLIGGGDIKLVFLMGLLLGYSGLLVALFLAINSAAIVGVTLILLKKKRRQDLIPFGPFLVAGTVAAYLFGQQLINFYLQLTGLDLLL